MKPIRVLVADDSALVRALLRDLLESEPGISVVGEASNGREAVELARSLRPDIVTMDLEMPVMNGLQAIEEIMCSKAVPILVVSGAADAQLALEAVGRGALEVVGKPDCSPQQAQEFIAKVRMLAGVAVITRLRPLPRRELPSDPLLSQTLQPLTLKAMPWPLAGRVFAIASSTGGPQALASILGGLPAGFPSPVLIAQHIADGFAQGMADWLASLCALPVRLAKSGEQIEPGVVYISPSEQHCVIGSGQRLMLVEQSPEDVYHPSCDRLLQSVADNFGARAAGIILTGMGRDGCQGMAAIRAAGGVTLAQDEASSVIYGMNRVAVEAGSVQRVLPLAEIASAMCELADPLRSLSLVGSL